MRILLLNYEYPPLGGGAGNATFYLLRELAKRPGLSIDAIVSGVGSDRQERFSGAITIHFLNIGKGANLHLQTNRDLVTYAWRAYRLARSLTKRRHYDVVQAFFGIPCGLIAWRLGPPFIISLRGSDVPGYNSRFRLFDHLVFTRLNRLLWRRARAVIANSEGLRRLALKTAPNQPIKVIPNGVDTEEFLPVSVPVKRPFTILSASRLIRRKGIEYLIEGFSGFLMNNKIARLVLVGSGDLEPILRRRVEELGISSAVDFRGVVAHAQMPTVYQSADVFVLPSLNEGMSNAILEAMACGLPVVTTDTGGAAELVDRRNGIIIQKENAAAITRALREVAAAPGQGVALGLASRQRAKLFSWPAVANHYYNLYQSYAQPA